MAVTYSSTLLGTFRSILTNALVSAATTAQETITLVHQLGASPHEIRACIRSSVVAAPSGAPIFNVQSWTASQATILVGNLPALGTCSVTVDLIAELTHSICR